MVLPSPTPVNLGSLVTESQRLVYLGLDVFHGDVSPAAVGDAPVGFGRASALLFSPSGGTDRVLRLARDFNA